MFDVVEVEIAPPHNKRVLAENLTERNAEAFIGLAIMRRGVERCFYKAVPRAEALEYDDLAEANRRKA